MLIPDATQRLADEAARLERLNAALTRAELIERSEAMLDIVGAIVDRLRAGRNGRARCSISTISSKSSRRCCATKRAAPGCATSSTAASATSWSMRARTPTRSNGRWSRALVAEFFYGESAADAAAHAVRGGRPEAVDLLVPGRRARGIRRHCGREIYYTARSVQLEIAPVRLRHSFRTLPDVLGRRGSRCSRGPICAAGVLERRCRAAPDGARRGRRTGDAVAADQGASRTRSTPTTGRPSRRKQQTQSARAAGGRTHRERDQAAGSTRGRLLGPRGRPVTRRRCADPGAGAQRAVPRDHPGAGPRGHADAGRRPAGGDNPYRRARSDGARRCAQQSSATICSSRRCCARRCSR